MLVLGEYLINFIKNYFKQIQKSFFDHILHTMHYNLVKTNCNYYLGVDIFFLIPEPRD